MGLVQVIPFLCYQTFMLMANNSLDTHTYCWCVFFHSRTWRSVLPVLPLVVVVTPWPLASCATSACCVCLRHQNTASNRCLQWVTPTSRFMESLFVKLWYKDAIGLICGLHYSYKVKGTKIAISVAVNHDEGMLPGGHYLDHYLGTLSSLSSHLNSFTGQLPVDFIYGYLICKWVAVT